MNQPATPFPSESPAFDRGIREQLEMIRRAVAPAEDKQLRDAVHPAFWERRGPFGRLRRRSGLRKVV
jgi:hypothetical protein